MRKNRGALMAIKKIQFAVAILTCIFLSAGASAQHVLSLPTIDKSSKQLLINHQPYLMLGGELANSSAASSAYLNKIWPKLSALHLNTVLVPVYWELMEPQEGKFNFDLV